MNILTYNIKMDIEKSREKIGSKKRHSRNIVYLTMDEIEKIIKEAKNPRDQAIIWIAFSKGLRASEIGLLRVQDVNLEKKRINIKRLKGSISNILPLTEKDLYYLKRYFKWRKKNKIDTEILFPSKRGKPISRKTLDRLFKKLCEKAGISPEKRHFHVLKHSLGIYILEKTGDIRLAQEILGHADIRSTQIYARYVDKKRNEKYISLFDY